MAFRNLGSFGGRYKICFDSSKGMFFYDDKKEIIVYDFKTYSDRVCGNYSIITAILDSFKNLKSEAVYDIEKDIISQLYDSIEEYELVNHNFYYIAGLRKQNSSGRLRAILKFPDELIFGWYDEIYLFHPFVSGKSEYLIYKENEKCKLIHYQTREILLEANFIAPAYIINPDDSYVYYFYIDNKENEIKFGIFQVNERKYMDNSMYFYKILEKRGFALVNASHIEPGKGLNLSKICENEIKFRNEFYSWKCPSCNKYCYVYIRNYHSLENFCLECDLEKLYIFLL